MNVPLRPCLRDPIPEIADAAQHLDAAVSAHLSGNTRAAEKLFRLANIPRSANGRNRCGARDSPYVRPRCIVGSETLGNSAVPRMPNKAAKALLHARDGYHCRFCGIAVISSDVRKRIVRAYPDAVTWGRRNCDQHAAFQAMWAQYDHVVPYQRGGSNDCENLVVTCAPCNFGRMDFLLVEVGLLDPRDREPVQSKWDGLARFS